MDHINEQFKKWNRYQTYVLCLVFLPSFLGGCLTLISSFTLVAPDNRCYVPGYDSSQNVSYTSPFQNNVSEYLFLKPEAQSGKLAYCQYCPYDEAKIAKGIYCTPKLARSCDSGHVYDTSQYKSSVSMQFNMVCDQAWRREMIKSLFMIGDLIGGMAFGCLSDKIGRRKTFLMAAFGGLIFFSALPWVTNEYVYYVVLFLGASMQDGTFLIGFIITMESIDGFPRTLAGMAIQAFFSAGYLYIGLAAYLIRYWQWLQFAVSIILILYIPYYWLFPESFRWLLANDKREEAQEVLNKMCKINGIPRLQLPKEIEINRPQKPQEKMTLMDLFKHKTIAIYSIITFFTWFVSVMTYYGLSLNATDLPGNDYVNFILFGISELPGFLISIPMMEKLGRKPTVILFLTVSGMACITSGLLPVGLPTAVVTTAVVGKMFIAGAVGIMYIYTAEIFPTSIRNTGIGFCSLFGRIGSILAPQIHLLADYVDEWLPIVIYGSFAVIAAFSDLFLPETKGRSLPESIDDLLDLTKRGNGDGQSGSGIQSEKKDKVESKVLERITNHDLV